MVMLAGVNWSREVLVSETDHEGLGSGSYFFHVATAQRKHESSLALAVSQLENEQLNDQIMGLFYFPLCSLFFGEG